MIRTQPTELPPPSTPRYDAASFERDVYERWIEAGVFTAQPERSVRAGGDREPFTIVMPPPNVTAVLHMGHGLNNTVQDVLIRWRRMAGDEVLWVPGTDHAGIATQNIVEKQLAREGKTRFDLGRDVFVERVASWVEATGGEILNQLRSIGASADWTRTAYTLAAELSRAVREAFVRFHEKGLIYRGHRVIHWCPRCLTSLSDEEAEHADVTGTLYHIRYPVVGEGGFVSVATTRPETMLGDVAVAVHPEDERYRALVGRSVRLPIANVDIPVIADAYVDPAFGTGAVKITPAHDPNDFELGVRHGLAMPLIMDPNAVMAQASDRVPRELRGLDRYIARDRIVAELRESNLLEREEAHAHAIRRCYRCDTVVEPRLSDQWFVRMEPLARPALQAVRTGRIRIMPERWEAVYVNWLENIRDWNISRQLWWGHRIPVWYCDECRDVIVSRDDVSACAACGGPVRQDTDVLDTWFSSGLWPLSTLGWPEQNARDLHAFYPTDMLVTAPEILFFWVARMIMMGYELVGEAPFHTVYLHGTVRDTNHVRMSKSLGNGIDPREVVTLYGADALRYTVIAALGVGADLILDPDDLERSFAPGRNFVTKLWNVGRFLLTNVGDERVIALTEIDPERLTRADHWILARLDQAIADCDTALGPSRPMEMTWAGAEHSSGLRLNEYAAAARRFVWDELADWYVESAKNRLAASAAERSVTRAVLAHAFDAALRLLHPLVPFITETLWRRLTERDARGMLATATWPRPRNAGTSDAALEFELVRNAVSALRQVRADYGVQPGRTISASLVGSTARATRVFDEESATIGRLARATISLTTSSTAASVAGEGAVHVVLADGSQVIVPLADAVDTEKECSRLRDELAALNAQLESLTLRLGNEQFVARAPEHVVQAERRKAREWAERRDQIGDKVKALCGE